MLIVFSESSFYMFVQSVVCVEHKFELFTGALSHIDFFGFYFCQGEVEVLIEFLNLNFQNVLKLISEKFFFVVSSRDSGELSRSVGMGIRVMSQGKVSSSCWRNFQGFWYFSDVSLKDFQQAVNFLRKFFLKIC